jgi:hypothetical protein
MNKYKVWIHSYVTTFISKLVNVGELVQNLKVTLTQKHDFVNIVSYEINKAKYDKIKLKCLRE